MLLNRRGIWIGAAAIAVTTGATALAAVLERRPQSARRSISPAELVLPSLGRCLGDADFDPRGDLNGDGCVNVLDVNIARLGPAEAFPPADDGSATGLPELILVDPDPLVLIPGRTGPVLFLLRQNTTPLFGYSLDVDILPAPDATGTLTANIELTNFFEVRNLITAAGKELDPLFSVILDPADGGVFVSANTADGSTVLAVDDVNDVLAEVFFDSSEDAEGEFTILLGPATALSDGQGFAVAFDFTAGTILVGGIDCNGNGIPDECDIADGTSQDCNDNGVPDECDIGDGTSQDCNDNGIPDECDVDCNGNGIPDDCELFDDCNMNGIPDECDIADGTSEDLNGNGIPDECERDLIIKQGACPAPLDRDSQGFLPVLLVGEIDFNIADVVLETLQLRRCDGVGGFAVPNDGPPGPMIKIKDLNHPNDDEVGCSDGQLPCACNDDQSSDGIDDLSMKFKTADLVAALELNDLDLGAIVVLCLTGELVDGSSFIACDCIRLVPPDTPAGLPNAKSNVPGVWIDVSP